MAHSAPPLDPPLQDGAREDVQSRLRHFDTLCKVL